MIRLGQKDSQPKYEPRRVTADYFVRLPNARNTFELRDINRFLARARDFFEGPGDLITFRYAPLRDSWLREFSEMNGGVENFRGIHNYQGSRISIEVEGLKLGKQKLSFDFLLGEEGYPKFAFLNGTSDSNRGLYLSSILSPIGMKECDEEREKLTQKNVELFKGLGLSEVRLVSSEPRSPWEDRQDYIFVKRRE